jgi:clan AA aspartic protease (TIGR02281 family)
VAYQTNLHVCHCVGPRRLWDQKFNQLGAVTGFVLAPTFVGGPPPFSVLPFQVFSFKVRPTVKDSAWTLRPQNRTGVSARSLCGILSLFRVMLALVMVFVSSDLLRPPVLPATTYRCTNEAGLSTFTDSPSQLQNCEMVSNNPPPKKYEPSAAIVPAPMPIPAETALTQPGNSAEVPGQVTVPVQRAGRSLTVLAKLNGTTDARLIVDTGADITILSHEVARNMGIFASDINSTVTLNTVGGSVRADVFRVGAISVGGAEVKNVPVAVHTMPDAPPLVDGLLGLTFLDKFLVTLDAQKGELHLRKRE